MLAVLGFVMTAVLGLLGAGRLALPIAVFDWLSFTRLRPLHTFYSIAAIVSGVIGLIHYAMPAAERERYGASLAIQFVSMGCFVVAGSWTLALGLGSGREYLSWTAPVAVFLLLPLLIAFYQVLSSRRSLERLSPEGLWLFGVGTGFLCVGLIESYLWMIPAIGHHPVRDLTIQWHGIDAFIAGVNVCLYGASMFLMDRKARPLRSRTLLIVATFSILFTFGHHHYVSPQPRFLKILAFVASMLAISSFVRHSRAYFASKKALVDASDVVTPLMRSVQLWTIMSLLSGILFAIPQLNLYLHGTYLVVIHAMGSMIGISLIIYAGVFKSVRRPLTARAARRVRFHVWLVNASVGALWLVMGVGGLYKGIMRVDTDYLLFAPKLELMYVGFVGVGLGLFAGLIGLSIEAVFALARGEEARVAKEEYAELVA